jgi:NADP-dependent 3-hydroxy acid dehydrogenase YdfG
MGAKLALSARRKDQLNEVLANVESLGAEGLVVPCDVLVEKEIEGCYPNHPYSFWELGYSHSQCRLWRGWKNQEFE